MTISSPKDLKRIELACNSAAKYHLNILEKIKKAIDTQCPERELVASKEFHIREHESYLILSRAALIQQETIAIHDKATS